MTIRVAINGYGRIGRMTLRAFYEQYKPHDFQIFAVNAPGQDEIARHLTQFDTVHGRFNASVSLTEDHQHLVVNGDHIRLLSERDPAKLPWDELDIDIELVPGQFGRITLGKQADMIAIYDQMLVILGQRYRRIKATMHGVKLSQMAGNLILTGCVDSKDLEVMRFVLLVESPQRHAANAAIAINRNTNGHKRVLLKNFFYCSNDPSCRNTEIFK